MTTIYNPLQGSHVKAVGAVAKKLVKACENKEVVLLPEDVQKLKIKYALTVPPMDKDLLEILYWQLAKENRLGLFAENLPAVHSMARLALEAEKQIDVMNESTMANYYFINSRLTIIKQIFKNLTDPDTGSVSELRDLLQKKTEKMRLKLFDKGHNPPPIGYKPTIADILAAQNPAAPAAPVKPPVAHVKPPAAPAAPPAPSPEKKAPPALAKPKPVDPNIVAVNVTLKTKTANKEYLAELKQNIEELENKGYNVDKLEKDIAKDDFVKHAVEAHIQALKFKLKTYKKLSEYKWQAGGGCGKCKKGKMGVKQTGGFFGEKQGNEINLNKVITDMSAEIEKQLAELKASKTAVEDKRNALLSILYDPDNGIATIHGKSRENVRLTMIKIVYMFFKVPEFFFKGFINFMITGPAGSGKTKIGGVVSHMMKNLGILATKNVTMATKQNMTAEFMGQSGPKTRKLLAKSIEGVLFIDEAYTLTPCPGTSNSGNSSYSEEAVGELINFIDKFVGCMVVIVAGYKQKMYDCFLAFNEGMARRFPRTVDLLNYTSDDLYEMFHSFLADSVDVDKVLDKKQLGYIKGIIAALNENGVFTNQAGDMLNLSKTVGEDAVLYSGEYNNPMIKLSFKKFCSSKGVAIDF